MCGIAGYFGKKQISDERINKCLNLMARRGPDSSALFSQVASQDLHVYLLHSRLNIIDLDQRANQPFKRDSKVFAYNGELYNYLEIKNELLGLGHTFTTESDTEVMLSAITHFGWEGL